MQTQNLNVTVAGILYAGFDFVKLPLDAAREVAATQVDQAADLARAAIVNDPLRAMEHQRAADEARTFAQGGYVGDMPPYVKAWADAASLEPQAAADSIIAEANSWDQALLAIRTTRLKGKQDVLKADSHAAVEAIADATMAEIKACIQGIGAA